MKKRAIVAEVAALRTALDENVDEIVGRLGEAKLALTDLASKVAWLHERVDTVATKLGNMRGDPALDGAAVKRLAFAVAQFSARLDRLEAPPPPKPKRKVAVRQRPPRTAK